MVKQGLDQSVLWRIHQAKTGPRRVQYKRYYQQKDVFNGGTWFFADTRGWYVSGGYKINNWLESGAYYSHYRINFNGGPLSR